MEIDGMLSRKEESAPPNIQVLLAFIASVWTRTKAQHTTQGSSRTVILRGIEKTLILDTAKMEGQASTLERSDTASIKGGLKDADL